MKKHRKVGFKERLSDARKHALAVLMDKGKVCDTANGDRVPTGTMCSLLGLTYTNGKPLTSGSEANALLHWHDTGFKTYTADLEKPTKAQARWSDARLMETAIAETMQNRRQWKR
jgi:hypothetical protein